MNSAESFNTNAPIVDGVKIELYEPNRVVLPIPENRVDAITYLELAIWITNNRSSPFIFNPDKKLSPQLVAPDGEILKRQESKGKWLTTELDGSRIPPQDYRIAHLQARLCWQNRALQLQFFIFSPQLKQFWTFGDLKPENYQLRFIDRDTSKFPMNESRLATQFVNLRLVKPVKSECNGVEVDGLCFETLVSEPVVSIPANRPNAFSSIKFGIRVTNNGLVPRRLLFFYLMPEILDDKGEQMWQDYARNATRFPRISDFIWLEPSENFNFVLEGQLSWFRNNLRLGGRDKSGGFWSFKALKANTYQVRLTYENKQPNKKLRRPENNQESVDSLWTGKVYTPYVKFRLINR